MSNEISFSDLQSVIVEKRQKELRDLRKRCDKHFFYFAEYVDSDKPNNFFSRDKPHAMLISMLYDLIDRGIIKKVTISLPPRGGKSWGTSKALQWQLGKHPEKTNMRNSYSAGLAVDVLSHQVRQSVLDPLFSQLYQIELDPAAKAKPKWNLKGSTRPSYCAAGIGGTSSGVGVDNWIVLDDEYSGMEQAMSKSIRRQTDNWIDSVHLARREGDFKELYVCTRWTEHDRIGQLKRYEDNYEIDFTKYLAMFEKEDVTDKRFEYIFKMFKKEVKANMKDVNTLVSLTVPALVTVDGEERSYCPAIFSTAHYLEERSRYKKRGQMWIWWSVFMQKPEASGNKIFQEINRFSPNRLWNLYDKPMVIAYIDPAFVPGGDYLAMPIAKVIDGSLYIVDVIYSKKGRDFTIPQIIKKVERWGITQIEGEGNGSGDEFLRTVREKLNAKGLYCSVKIIKNSGDKVARVMMRSGDVVERCHFLNKEDYPNSKEDEYSNFMYDLLGSNVELDQDNDDAPDSMSGLVYMRGGMPNSQANYEPL